jgi:hypothetical protein
VFISNLLIVMQQASINLVLACGMTLVILTAGLTSLLVLFLPPPQWPRLLQRWLHLKSASL